MEILHALLSATGKLHRVSPSKIIERSIAWYCTSRTDSTSTKTRTLNKVNKFHRTLYSLHVMLNRVSQFQDYVQLRIFWNKNSWIIQGSSESNFTC